MSVVILARGGARLRATEPPPPVLGTIDDLAATAGDGQVSLSWTPAENATSHQIQYRAGTSGSWIDFGSPLGGAADSGTVTGLVNDQLYQFRIAASDGNTTTTSNTASATPEAPSELHPNEPAGMTVLGYADGSVAHADNRTFGLERFSAYQHPSNLSVVSDPGNPTGSGSAVRVDWGGTDSGLANFNLSAGGPWRTIYISYRVVIPTSWTIAHKWMYIQPSGGGAPGDHPWIAHEPGDTLRCVDADNNVSASASGVLAARDTEILMELVLVCDSSPGADDGHIYMFINGEAVGDGVMAVGDPGTPWGNIHYYNHANANGGTYFDVREFYVSARSDRWAP